MSIPYEIESPKLTGWEIQPFIKKVEAGVAADPDSARKRNEWFCITDRVRKFIGKIMKEFREKVKKEEKEKEARQAVQTEQLAAKGIHIAAKAESAIPLSFRRPGEEGVHPFESSQMRNQYKRKRQSKCPVAGTTAVSFILPEDLLSLADNIDLYTPEHLLRPTTNRRYTIQQRTEGWTVEKRQRDTKICDTYYIHRESKGSFRSVIEVTDFILYEIYPKKPTPTPRKKNTEEESSSVVRPGEKKKVGRPRKNKEDGEQGSTLVKRKVGRPRKVVDGEQSTSSSVPIKEE